MQGNGTTSPVFTKKVTSPVAVPAVLAVTRLYVLAQRIDLAVQAKHESLSQVSTLQTLFSAPLHVSTCPFLYFNSMSPHKVCTAKQYAIALASVCLTHCCVSDARS